MKVIVTSLLAIALTFPAMIVGYLFGAIYGGFCFGMDLCDKHFEDAGDQLLKARKTKDQTP